MSDDRPVAVYYYYAIKVGKMVTHVHLLGTPDIFCLRINFLINQNKSIGYTFLSDEKIRVIKYEGISRQMFLYHVVQPGK